MNRLNKKQIAVGVGIAIVIIMVIIGWPKEEKMEEERGVPTGAEKEIPTTFFKSPNSISWQIKSIDLPEKLAVLFGPQVGIDKIEADRVARVLGLGSTGREIGGAGSIIYGENNKSLYVNKNEGAVEFEKNLLLQPLEKVAVTADETVIKDSLVVMLKKLLANRGDLGVEVSRVRYEKVEGPRFVTSSMDEAEIIAFGVVYKYGDYPVVGLDGDPIEAKYSRDGELVKLWALLPPSKTLVNKAVAIKSFEEIKNEEVGRYRILTINGTAEYEVSAQDEMVAATTVTAARVAYIYLPKEAKLEPIVRLEGNTALSSGPATIVMAVAAGKN